MSLLEGEIDSVQVKHGYSHRMRPCKDNFRTKLSLNGLLNDLTKMFIVSGNHKYKETECKIFCTVFSDASPFVENSVHAVLFTCVHELT